MVHQWRGERHSLGAAETWRLQLQWLGLASNTKRRDGASCSIVYYALFGVSTLGLSTCDL